MPRVESYQEDSPFSESLDCAQLNRTWRLQPDTQWLFPAIQSSNTLSRWSVALSCLQKMSELFCSFWSHCLFPKRTTYSSLFFELYRGPLLGHLKHSKACNFSLQHVLPTPPLTSLLRILLVWNPNWLYEIRSIKNIILYPATVNVLFVIRVLYKWDATMSLCGSSPSFTSLGNTVDARSFTLKRPLWKGFFDCGKITPSMSLDCKGGQCPQKKRREKKITWKSLLSTV